MEQNWVEKILKCCRRKKVPFFFKQWGGVHKSTTGRSLHGMTYDEMPPQAAAVMPPRKVRVLAASEWQNRAKHWLSPPTVIESLVSLETAGA
jgi:hypothetical protein